MFYRCPRCGELFASDTLPLATCGSCGALLRVTAPRQRPPITVQPKPTAAVVSEEKLVVPWEQPGRPTLVRFFSTMRLLLRSAPRFFFHLEPTENGHAERFAYLACLIGFAGYFGGELLLFRDPTQAQALSDAFAQAMGGTITAPTPAAIAHFFKLGLVLSPALAILPVHIAAGLYQFGLALLGLPSRGFAVTFRVAAYGLAPMVLLAIPGIGILLAPGWILALHWVGLSAGHRVPLLFSAIAIALPSLGFFALFATIAGRLLLGALGT